MTNKYCDSPIHKCLCLSLALIFIFTIVLSVPAAADDITPSPSPSHTPIHPNVPVGWKEGDTFRDILLAVLDDWGISFAKSDPDDETSILEYSDQLMQEFYDANETSQELFWDLVQYGASETGKIILDFLGVNKIRQFANWLKDKFDLTDNSTVPVSSDPSSPNTMFHVIPYSGISFSGFHLQVSTDFDQSEYPIYLSFYNYNGGSSMCFHTNYNYPRFTAYFTYGNNLGSSYSVVLNPLTYDGSYYTYTGSAFYLSSSQTPSGVFLFNSVSDAVAAFNSFHPGPSISNSFVINTTIINIPSEDLDPDDGMEIEVPGTNWGDSIYTILNIIERLIGLYDSTQLNINTVIELISTLLQGLQKSVSVENIPGAVVLDYDEYDIPLENEWSLVDGFFSEETEGSPFSTLTTILYGFPEPIILFFSVIVVFVVAYGFIRLGRDSH